MGIQTAKITLKSKIMGTILCIFKAYFQCHNLTETVVLMSRQVNRSTEYKNKSKSRPRHMCRNHLQQKFRHFIGEKIVAF